MSGWSRTVRRVLAIGLTVRCARPKVAMTAFRSGSEGALRDRDADEHAGPGLRYESEGWPGEFGTKSVFPTCSQLGVFERISAYLSDLKTLENTGEDVFRRHS